MMMVLIFQASGCGPVGGAHWDVACGLENLNQKKRTSNYFYRARDFPVSAGQRVMDLVRRG
jgi:hypothetical protein